MENEPHYRTYLMKIWVLVFFALPTLLFFILLLFDTKIIDDDSDPLLMAAYLSLMFLFIIPTFLFVTILSEIVARVTHQRKKLRIVTIVSINIGLIVCFFLLYEPDYVSTSQLIWGIITTLLFGTLTTIAGLKFKL
jgi:hypothetical protein